MDRFKDWAIRLSGALDDFIWLHSGGNGRDLNIVYRNSLNLVCGFRKELGAAEPLGLKVPESKPENQVESFCKEAGISDFDARTLARHIACFVENLDLESFSPEDCRQEIADKIRVAVNQSLVTGFNVWD
jgi:hypothetical protein